MSDDGGRWRNSGAEGIEALDRPMTDRQLPPIDTHLQLDRIHAADCWCNPLGPNGRPEVPLDGIDDRPKVILEPLETPA